MSTNGEWIKQMWYIRILKHSSAIKRNEILNHAITGMNLKDIMLSEEARYQKQYIARLHLYEILRPGELIEPRSTLVVGWGWEGRMNVSRHQGFFGR